jgi:lambda family phage portal protein
MARPKITLPEPNWVDRLVNFVAPTVGLSRMTARAKQAVIRGYGQSFDATRDGKGKKERNVTGGAGDQHLDQKTLWEIREICYENDRNEALSSAVIDQATVNVIGPWGFAHYVRTSSPELNKQVERGFAKWLAEECDPAGEDHGWERIRRSYRSTKIAGDEHWQTDDYDRFSPPVFRTIEAPRILTPYERSPINSGAMMKVNGREMIHGITRDANGRPDYMFVADGIPLTANIAFADGKLMRADRIISLIRRRRESETRGRPIMTPVIRQIDDLSDLMTSERLALRLAAALGIFITTDDDPTALANYMSELYGEIDSNGDRLETLDPMSINYLKRGQEAKMLQAQRPQSEVQAFMRTIMRYVGLPLGMPYELFFLDFSEATLGTLRVALTTAQRRFRDEQFWLSTKLDRLYKWWLDVMLARGRYPRVSDIYEHEWGLPGWPSPQPLQDAQAARIAIEDSFGSRTIATRNLLGEDWQTVLQDLNREDKEVLKRANAAGYNIATDPGKQLPAANKKGATKHAA